MGYVVQPQVRRTSEIRFHSDLAPGQRFVFVGRVIDPVCRLYIVGRRVEHVPADQPEWLDDHAHNCPTFYVLIGGNPDLTGLAAEIVIEGRAFLAEAPSAIMLPPGFVHHHRLVSGSGWSFHVNVRSDYEESLVDDRRAGGDAKHVRVDRLYRRAERSSPAALRWEIQDGAITAGNGDRGPTVWKFIDPEEFSTPGVRLHAHQLSAETTPRWSEAPHRHANDEVNIILSDDGRPLELEATSAAETAIVRAPVSLYHQPGVPHRYNHISGNGLVLKVLRL